MKKFLLEFGRDFIFIDEEYYVQVGNNDYYVDLFFYHRELQCLVAIDLKIDDFKPEYMGKMDFYLEALDRDIKKPHENPSVGMILCKNADTDVVEYSLSRSLSQTMIAEHKTKKDFWHIELETLPYRDTASKGKYCITTFLHGMYYPEDDCFTHIDPQLTVQKINMKCRNI